MFSVNIDKIVDMTDNERKCYEELVKTLKSELGTSKCLAVTKDGLSAFKIAYSFVATGEKVLFIDADIMSEIFLGKYKLGKILKVLQTLCVIQKSKMILYVKPIMQIWTLYLQVF